MKTKTLCGLRPSGRLHIGHYFSVIQPSKLYGADVLIATFHAPTNPEFVEHTLRRFGVTRIVYQQDVFKAPFYFRLMELARVSELRRMTQYKVCAAPSAHLLTYPVLMAHDVADYDEIIVGDDQKQHLEYAQRLLRRYNTAFPIPVKIPSANILGGRVMSLTDPTKKMSKSDPKGCLFLDDFMGEIRHKIRRAVTTPEGLANLHEINMRLGGSYDPALGNEQFKEKLSELVISKFNTII